MTVGKTIGLKVALALGGNLLIRNSPRDCLTTILFHSFTFNEEPLTQARERLKIQCEWLKSNYHPLTLSAATEGVREGNLPKKSLLITIDDAHLDILEVFDIFESFELPVAIFVCAGWSANASQPEAATVLAGLVSDLEWYEGPDRELSFPCGTLNVLRDKWRRRETVTELIKNRDNWRPYLAQIVEELNSCRPARRRNFCNWQELIELQNLGVEIGCHSVSHMNLAEADQTRLRFEIMEAREILVAKFGRSEVFAYPFGGPADFSQTTSETLRQAGFRCAFLTRSDFASGRENPLELPRIPLPDRPMSLSEFRARVGGGGVVIANMRNYMHPYSRKINDRGPDKQSLR
jgi:peptidoglycan/xylan/chitin deacetylase (PgdA/CDA1 family)